MAIDAAKRHRAGCASVLALSFAMVAAACTGRISGGAVGPGSAGAPGAPGPGPGGTTTTPGGPGPITPGAAPDLTSPRAFGRLGLRRLSHSEYRRTVEDALGITLGPELDLLPSDPGEPFDNEYRKQLASAAWIEGAKGVADRVAAKVVADDAVRTRLAGCTPTGPADAKCLTQFVTTVGRRLLRRPLAADEIAELVAFQTFAQKEANFWIAPGMVLRTLLQDLEFLYRVETGTPVAGQTDLFALNGFEMATRLSFLLWGSGPDDALLDAAAAGTLKTPKQLQDTAVAMLQSPKALRQIQGFHAAWFGYEALPHAQPLSDALVAETNALVERVILRDRRSWLDLFTATETWISSPVQAELYGLPMPASGQPGWVSYGATGRKGILSHGSVLSNGAKATDTSPTLRGVFVRMRIMCENVPPPPPNVNSNLPPPAAASPCKADRYAAHRTDVACGACHSLLDPIGFGLENYDTAGKYRTQEPGSASCSIPGQGDVPGLGSFSGPAQLTDLLLKAGKLDSCLSKHIYQFAMGRPEGVGAGDDGVTSALLAQLTRDGNRLDQLLLDFVAAPAFQHRWVE